MIFVINILSILKIKYFILSFLNTLE